MITFLLALLVLGSNLLVYLLHVPQYYQILSHSYYGVMMLAVIYDREWGQKFLLTLTAAANLIYAFHQPIQIQSIVVAFFYPFLVLGVIHIIRQLRTERGVHGEQLKQINNINADLEKRVRDLSTLFEVSQAANANLELAELFQRIIEILSNRLGIYRGALHLYNEKKVVTSAEVVLGLTPAELKRGTDGLIGDIQKRVLATGKAVGVPHARLPRSYVKLFELGSEISDEDSSVITKISENGNSEIKKRGKDAIAFWCIPVIVEEQVVGTLTIDKASDEFSAEDDQQLLTIVASIIAQRVKIQQTIEALVESERLATLGRLVRTIAHEVRNPLSSIRLGTQLLQQTTESESDEYAEIIIKEVDRLNRFIEQLLAFSKPAMEFAKPCDIHELLTDSLSICETELQRYAIQVVTKYQSPYPKVNVNPDGITQVLLNLFYNAIEAMEAGGTLTLRTEYRKAEKLVYISVQDTGPGILPDEVPQLFHPFYTTKQKGTGLGLYISRKILEEHNGSIDVKAGLAVGAAFIITLPGIEARPMGGR